MQNTIKQKSEFSKMRDCSGFLQIGSHIVQWVTRRGFNGFVVHVLNIFLNLVYHLAKR